MFRKCLRLVSLCALVALLSGCFIIDIVIQPNDANTGAIVTVVIAGRGESNVGEGAYLGAHLPEGWTVVSAEWEFDTGGGISTGVLVYDASSASDLQASYPETGYFWWSGLTDHDAGDTASDLPCTATLRIQVGNTPGAYYLDYYVGDTYNEFPSTIDDQVDDVPLYILSDQPAFALDPSGDSLKYGLPNETVRHTTVTLTNIRTTTDSFAISLAGNAWPTRVTDGVTTDVIAQTGDLPTTGSRDLVVEVDIPPGAVFGDADRTTVTVASNTSPTVEKSFVVETRALSGNWGYACLKDENLVSVFDRDAMLHYRDIDVSPFGSGPIRATVHPDGSAVWVCLWDTDQVLVIDTTTNETSGVIDVGGSPRDLVFSLDGSTAYVANWGDDTIEIVDVATSVSVGTIPVQDGPLDLAIDPCGGRLLMGHMYDDFVTVIDLDTNTTVALVDMGGDQYSLAVSPDGAFCYVTPYSGVGDYPLQFIDLATYEVFNVPMFPEDPEEMALSPQGRYLYTVCEETGEIFKVDTLQRRVVGAVDVLQSGGGSPTGPRDIESSPDGSRLYACVLTDRDMVRVDARTMSETGRLDLPGYPVDIAVYPQRFACLSTPTLTKTALDTTASLSQDFSYEIQYEYNGADELTSAAVFDPLPPYGRYVSSSGGLSSDRVGGGVLWELGDLTAPASGTLSVTMAVDHITSVSTSVVNLARMGPTFAEARASSVTVLAPDVGVVANPPAIEESIFPDGFTTFTIDIYNMGATTDTFDLGLEGGEQDWLYRFTTGTVITTGTEPVAPFTTYTINLLAMPPQYGAPGDEDITTVTVTSQNDPAASDTVGLHVHIGDPGIYLAFDCNAVFFVDRLRKTVIPGAIDTTPYGDGPLMGDSLADRTRSFVSLSDSDRLLVLDNNEPTTALEVGVFPYGVAVTRDDRYVLVCCYDGNALHVIDTMSLDTVTTVAISGPVMVDVCPRGRNVAYVTSPDNNEVIVVDLTNIASPTTSSVTGVFDYPFDVAFSLDGRLAYVTNYNGSSVSKIDVTSDTVADEANLPGIFAWPSGVAVSPDGRAVYATDENGNFYVLDTETMATSTTGNVEAGGFYADVSPDNREVWLAGDFNGGGAVVHPADLSVVRMPSECWFDSGIVFGPTRLLAVNSLAGDPTPGRGLHFFEHGTSVTAAIDTDIVTSGVGRRYLLTEYDLETDTLRTTGTDMTVGFMMDGDTTLTWQWRSEVRLDTSVSPAGAGTIAPPSGWYEEGTTVSLEATANPGWVFVGFAGDAPTTDSPQVLALDEPATVTANFRQLATLTVSSPYGAPTPPVGDTTFMSGDLVEALIASTSVTVADGHRAFYDHYVLNVNGAVTSGTESFVTFDIHTSGTLDWLWRDEYLLETGAAPPEGGAVTPATGWRAAGERIDLLAEPNIGWGFTGFVGDVTTDSLTVSFDLSAPTRTTGTFAPYPGAPFDPRPPDEATSIGVATSFTWQADNATTYDWTLWLGPPDDGVTSWSLTGLTQSDCQPTTALDFATSYTWRVTARNGVGATGGPFWTFATERGLTAQDIIEHLSRRTPLSPEMLEPADVNGDGVVDIADVIQILLGARPAAAP